MNLNLKAQPKKITIILRNCSGGEIKLLCFAMYKCSAIKLISVVFLGIVFVLISMITVHLRLQIKGNYFGDSRSIGFCTLGN